MPDLIIYPNRTSITGVPKIDFIGASGSGISLQVTQDGSINFMGTAGNLFSITDSLSGSLMSVNDIAGLPILEVFDDDRVVMGSFGTNALVVSGSGAAFGTNLVDKNRVLVISGHTTYIGEIYSGTVNISDLFYPRSNPSGYVTTSQTGGYATKLELIATGRRAWDDAINLSGRLFATGASLQSQISSNDSDIATLKTDLVATGRRGWDDSINLSGRLFATGALIAGVSGGLEARISASSASTLSSANTYANGIGTNLSGNLYTTGSTLFDRDASISGGLEARISASSASTLSSANTYSNGIGVNLSGRYTALSGAVSSTGSVLWERDSSISGGLQAQIGGFATTAALVATGRRAWDDAINLSGRLFATGASLQSQISSNDSDISTLTTNLNATGRRAWDDAINLSGRLFATGALIASVSGGLQSQINNKATILSLNETGRRAWDDAINISGRLFTTGSSLDGKINSLSGYLPYIREPFQTITANYSVVPNNPRIYCNNTNSITITFPSAVTYSGQLVNIKLINTGFALFTGTFGQKFDNSDAYVAIGQFNTYEVHSNGSNWYLW